MTFTGRLGTPNSLYANIMFAAVDGFDPGSPDYQAHQLTSVSVRILFTVPVTDGAADTSVYSFSSTAPPGDAYVPDVLSVDFYDETHESVVVRFAHPLTTATQYSVTVSTVVAEDGSAILGSTKLFTANVVDPPRAVGAFLSKRGYVDVLFDKPVGPYSASATFFLSGDTGPALSMAQAAWGPEGLPDTTLRLQIPTEILPSAGFIVSTVGVTDISVNSSSESVPLTLVLRSPPPFSYNDLVRLQLTDAFVTDVSSDFLRTANVRAFFSCPVSGADVTGSWSASASGAHPFLDDQDPITLPPATDLASLKALLNQAKSRFNDHLLLEQVHLSPIAVTGQDSVLAPDATDLDSAVILVNALSASVASHYARSRVHLYQDTVNSFKAGVVPHGDIGAAMAVANLVCSSYSGHILPRYPLQFSSAYQDPLGPITAYAVEDVTDGAFDVSGPYTYFADLKVILDVEAPSVFLSATLTSEDGGSTTSPANYTGSIVARPGASPAVVTSSLVRVDRWVDVRTDRNVSAVSDLPLVIVGDDGLEIPTSPSVSGSLPTVFWAYNNALEAYRQHIIPGAAGHQMDDDVNLVSPDDYGFLPLASAISAANKARLKIMAHMASPIYHYHADPNAITSPEATDAESLLSLVADMAQVVAGHLVRVGPHLFSGYRIVSAPVYDVVRLTTDFMLDGTASRVVGSLQDSYVYNGLPVLPAPSEPIARSHVTQADVPFVALAVRPSLSSVLPQSGLSFDPVRGPQLGSDSVLAFFSKPMRQVPLDSSNLRFTGGPMQFLGAEWSGPSLVSVAVTNMSPILYSADAVGLMDEAGNAVYG